MNRKAVTFVFLVLSALALCPGALAGTDGFKVAVEQNGTVVPIEDGVIRLKKAPFNFTFTLTRPTPIQVAASLDPGRFDLARQGAPMHEFMKSGTGAAEGLFNEHKLLFVGKNHTNYWYYDSDEDNRFDLVKHTEGSISCRRTIESLFLTDEGKRVVPIADFDARRLYLVFVNIDPSNGYVEIQRECIIIEFIQEV